MHPSLAAFPTLSRRRWLRWALGGAAGVTGAVALGGGALLGLRGCAPAIDGLQVLGDHPYRTLSAVARTLLPAGGAFPPGAADVDLARAFDEYLADEPEANVGDLTMALHWLELGPVLYDWRLATFSNLDDDERFEHWQTWTVAEDLDRRKVSIAFRKFVYLVFYDQPIVWEHIGYAGP